MKFVLMQEVEANSLAEAMTRFSHVPVVITSVEATIKPPEPNIQRLGTQTTIHSLLRGKGKGIPVKLLAEASGLGVKQTSNALTNLKNKGRAKSNVRGWYKS